MSRRRGEQQPHQENVGTQSRRSSKDEGNQTAVAAAVKLEWFVHTPVQTPTKGGQQTQEKAQLGAPPDRKSHGQPSATPAALAIKTK